MPHPDLFLHAPSSRREAIGTGLGLAAAAAALFAAGGAMAAIPRTPAPPGAEGFDFFLGDWRVRHRQLQQRLAGSTEWIEFGGVTSTRRILGGWGNLDENILEKPAGAYQAVTMRLFDPKHAQWSIWWIDARNPSWIEPAVVGRFENGRGVFYGDDIADGRPIRARFIWSGMTATSCNWEQAWSADGGRTWEDNWYMAFTRI